MPAVRKNKERDNLKSAYNLVMNEDYVEKANKSQDQMENIMDVRLDIRNNVVTLLCLTKCGYAIKIINIKYEVRCGLLLCIFMLLCNFRGLLDQ